MVWNRITTPLERDDAELRDTEPEAKTLLAMTSLSPSEFDALLTDFTATWNEVAGTDRSKGGRPPVLRTMADRLLFILFYL